MDCRRQPHRGETSGRERAKREHRSDAVLRSTNFSENALRKKGKLMACPYRFNMENCLRNSLIRMRSKERRRTAAECIVNTDDASTAATQLLAAAVEFMR